MNIRILINFIIDNVNSKLGKHTTIMKMLEVSGNDILMDEETEIRTVMKLLKL